jgi:hypothetical protein
MAGRGAGFNEGEGRAEQLSEAESRLYSRLIPSRQKDAIRIDDPAFDFYDPQKRSKDQERVEGEKRFHAQRDAEQGSEVGSARAKLFEAMIEDQIMQSDWMGPDAIVIVPSEYDDYVNHVDTILEFDRPGQISHLTLGVDITNSVRHVAEKFAGIKRSIEEGTLSKVEYFKSTHSIGKLNLVPQVVIGADAKTRREMAELVLQYRILKDNPNKTPDRHEEFKRLRSKLETHSLQFKLLYSIKSQLEAFAAYAKKMDQEDLAAVYERTNQIIKEILKDKETPEGKDHFEFEDEVYGLIVRYARELAQSAKT